MSRAQTEMIGLAIIVLIMIIGMVFAMKFLIKEPKILSDAGDKQVATAFLNTLLSDKLEVNECKVGVELKELIQDCSTPPELPNRCADNTITYCQKAETVIKGILEGSLKPRKKEYEFYLCSKDLKNCAPGKAVIEDVSNQRMCRQDKTQVIYPLPTEYGTVFTVLNICTKS
ncbi:hypothetical protein HYU11_00825 [Candidatus Woesearchaeota archaeon]|nr:hypothetical protein [Candidatus Woesearchaeota archaeon]